jgi:hypothetical protein
MVQYSILGSYQAPARLFPTTTSAGSRTFCTPYGSICAAVSGSADSLQELIAYMASRTSVRVVSGGETHALTGIACCCSSYVSATCLSTETCPDGLGLSRGTLAATEQCGAAKAQAHSTVQHSCNSC